MNILSAINRANQLLKLNGIVSSKLDCEILISKVLKTDRANVILNLNKNLTNNELDHFNELIDQRSKKNLLLIWWEKKNFGNINLM